MLIYSGVVDQHQLYVTPNQNCVLPAECPSNTFVDTDNFACTTCDDGVVTCEGVGPGNALTCGRTSKGVSLFFDATDKACVTADACPVSTWADEATSTCVQCDDGETSCSGNGSGDAISCGKNKKGESTYLHPSKDCVIADQCPVAFFADEASSTCVQCDKGEASCVSAGPGGATSCAKNAAGDQLFLDPSGECVTAKDCPVATFADKTDNTCSACGDGALICTSKTDASLWSVSDIAFEVLHLADCFDCSRLQWYQPCWTPIVPRRWALCRGHSLLQRFLARR